MSKVTITKLSKADGITKNSLFEDWKIMRQALEDEERKFKEVSINKVHVLTTYLFIRIPVVSICIIATRSIVCSFLCVLSLLISFFYLLQMETILHLRVNLSN